MQVLPFSWCRDPWLPTIVAVLSVYNHLNCLLSIIERQDTYESKGAAVDLYGETVKPVIDQNEMLRVSHKDETQPGSQPNYQQLGTNNRQADPSGLSSRWWREFMSKVAAPPFYWILENLIVRKGFLEQGFVPRYRVRKVAYVDSYGKLVKTEVPWLFL